MLFLISEPFSHSTFWVLISLCATLSQNGPLFVFYVTNSSPVSDFLFQWMILFTLQMLIFNIFLNTSVCFSTVQFLLYVFCFYLYLLHILMCLFLSLFHFPLLSQVTVCHFHFLLCLHPISFIWSVIFFFIISWFSEGFV